MNIFDIIGPIMVGPSSSHTAGAVKIGFISRQLLNERVKNADIYLHGSFLATGKGHGTDKALVAGLLGMNADDIRIPQSFEIAKEEGLIFRILSAELRAAHPNTVMLKLTGENGGKLEVTASSLGGGRIEINKIDGLDANFNGDFPTLIINNQDEPGHIAEITKNLSGYNINIASMQVYRSKRGADAVMIFECDEEIPREFLERISKIEGIKKATYFSLEEN